MIIPPNIFRQIKWQARFANSAFRRKSSFKISPETFKPVNMTFTASILMMLRNVLHQSVHITFSRNASITTQSVGPHYRTRLYTSTDKTLQCSTRNIRNNLCPNFTSSAKNAKNRSFQLCSSPRRGNAFVRPKAAIAPGSSNICFVNFNGSFQNWRNFLFHSFAQNHQSAYYSLSMESGFFRNRLYAQASNMPSQNVLPLMASQTQGQPRTPVVSATNTAKHFSSDNPCPGVTTSRAILAFCHEYFLSY